MQMAINNLGRLWPALRAFAAAVVIAVLIFSSVADAATCGGEIEDASSIVALQDGEQLPDPRDAPADEHQGTCPHGHCHHGNQPLGADNRNSTLDHDGGTSRFSLVNEAGPEAFAELLIPPPRA